jgi:hypothetical protein
MVKGPRKTAGFEQIPTIWRKKDFLNAVIPNFYLNLWRAKVDVAFQKNS